MVSKRYIGAYTEKEGADENIAFRLKKRMKSELYNATKTKQYPVHGNGYTGGVVVVEVTSMDVPDDMDEFKESVGADYVSVASRSRRADAEVNDKRKD